MVLVLKVGHVFNCLELILLDVIECLKSFLSKILSAFVAFRSFALGQEMCVYLGVHAGKPMRIML